MWFRRKKEIIHFSGRRQTKMGILSGLSDGKGGLLLGMIGLTLLILSVTGLVVSYKAFKKKDIFYGFPIAGAVINGFMLIVLFTLYLLGM